MPRSDASASTRTRRPTGPAKPTGAPVTCSTVSSSASVAVCPSSTCASLVSESSWSPRTRTATAAPPSSWYTSVFTKRSGGRPRNALTSSTVRRPGVATRSSARLGPSAGGAGRTSAFSTLAA
jgi:hypothetical protein